MPSDSIKQLCQASSLSEADAALMLAETGGDVNLALMLVQHAMTSARPAPAQTLHPAVAELQRAIDGCSGSAAAVQELAASVAAFEKADTALAIQRAQAAHHPLWQDCHRSQQISPLLSAIDAWIQFLRNDTESESLIYEKAQRTQTIVIPVAAAPDLARFLEQEAGIDRQELDGLSERARAQGLSFADLALAQTSLARPLERFYGMGFFSWSLHPWDPALVEAYGLEEAVRRGLLPVSRREGKIVVGLLNPADLGALSQVRATFAPAEVEPVIIRRGDFDTILQFCRDVPA